MVIVNSKGDYVWALVTKMTSKYEQAIKDLQRLDRKLEELGVKPVSLVATVGELLVMRELESEEIEFEAKGGQAICDIILKDGNRCVEVKTSTAKVNKKVQHFGWTVKRHGTRKKEFDFLICVGIEDIKRALIEPVFYIFTGEEARRIPERKMSHLSSVKAALDICRSEEDLKRLIDRNGIEGWAREINENLERFKGNWDRLRN